MKAQCKTCLFNDNVDPMDRARTQSRLLESSLTCHGTGWPEGTHLCRGARDFQLRLLTAMGYLNEPTDAEFERVSREMGAL